MVLGDGEVRSCVIGVNFCTTMFTCVVFTFLGLTPIES